MHPVSALGHVAGIAEALHQLRPGSGHVLGTPASARRFSGKSVTRHRRDDDVECIVGLPAVRDWICQPSDELDLLDHRARPAVVDDHRKRILLTRPDVDEMNVEPIDLGDELRQSTEPRLHLAPVIFCPPVARERLHGRKLHALRCIGNGFAFRPLGRVDAPAQFGKFRIRKVHVKRTNRMLISLLTTSCSNIWIHGLSSF